MIAAERGPDFRQSEADRVRAYRSVATAYHQDCNSRFGDLFDRGPVNPQRRERCGKRLLDFCKTYQPLAFALDWAPYHVRAAERIEAAVWDGQMYAFAMPRGSGKSTLCRAAAIWAVAYGYSLYVVLIGATMKAVRRHMTSLKKELQFNDLLAEDFPEMCLPVRHIGGETRKAPGQKYKGESTQLEWSAEQIVFATLPLPYAKCSGAIIDVASIEGEIRGRHFVRQNGSVVRPTLAIPDDPQTRETARSAALSAQREEILAGDIRYMQGPDAQLGVVMPCTVIVRGDMADRILDRKLHPEFHGERSRMLDSFPKNTAWWDKYAELRNESFRADGKGEPANELYARERAIADEGAVATWPDLFYAKHGEISAVQHAMNLRLSDEAAFMAEGQNEPQAMQELGAMQTADAIAEKLHGHERGIVPAHCQCLTAFIDVQMGVLLYGVVAWADAFTGYVVEYGAFPRQTRRYFTKAKLNPTLADLFKGADEDGRIYQGLAALTEDICGRGWQVDGGSETKLSICLIDEGHKTDVVHKFVRASKFSGILRPSKGYADLARFKFPFLQAKRRPGDRLGSGLPWRERYVPNGRGMRFISFDTNRMKSFLHQRLATPVGSVGALTFYGHKAAEHRLVADHLLAEYPSRVQNESTGRTVDEWQERPGRPDNDLLDVLVGCLVGAAYLGMQPAAAALPAASGQPRQQKATKRGPRKTRYF